MPTPKQIGQFQQTVQAMHSPACRKTARKTHSEVMATDRLSCEHCGKRLPFDKDKWRSQVVKPPAKDLNQRINERAKTDVLPDEEQDPKGS